VKTDAERMSKMAEMVIALTVQQHVSACLATLLGGMVTQDWGLEDAKKYIEESLEKVFAECRLKNVPESVLAEIEKNVKASLLINGEQVFSEVLSIPTEYQPLDPIEEGIKRSERGKE
jgi:hypothetical protein